jgi:hypothetical protein
MTAINITAAQLADQARELIETGEDPQALAHEIFFDGWPKGAHLSTRLPAGSDLSGYTARYKTLAQWAAGGH